jgi:hypothetical protein
MLLHRDCLSGGGGGGGSGGGGHARCACHRQSRLALLRDDESFVVIGLRIDSFTITFNSSDTNPTPFETAKRNNRNTEKVSGAMRRRVFCVTFAHVTATGGAQSTTVGKPAITKTEVYARVRCFA